MPKLDKNLEERLKAEAARYLEKARPGYDLPHTFSAVEYMKLLIEKEGRNYKDINEKILVTVMYLHDIGYSNLVDANNLDLVLKSKAMHMNIGMAETIKILDKIGGYTKKEIEKIAYLVSIHDEIDLMENDSEKFILEADSLGMLDYSKVPPYPKEEYDKFIKRFKERRVPRFITKTGKEYLAKLLEKAEKYYKI